MNNRWWAACLVFVLLTACSADEPQGQDKLRQKHTVVDTSLERATPPLVAKSFLGAVIVGGRYCLGDAAGSSLDVELSALNQPLRNAAIKGEPLEGLLERLPYLLAQQPELLIVEIGLEDEKAQTSISAFNRNLRRLRRLLAGKTWVLLSTANGQRYKKALVALTDELDVPLVAVDPAQSELSAVARQLLPVLAK